MDAQAYCSGFGLRLPSVSEAMTMATNYDVDGVGANDFFWTEPFYFNGTYIEADMVREDGVTETGSINQLHKTVCVTDPTSLSRSRSEEGGRPAGR